MIVARTSGDRRFIAGLAFVVRMYVSAALARRSAFGRLFPVASRMNAEVVP
jgi:hypothetical protein